MIPYDTCMYLLVQCIYMFALHTMRPFDACFQTGTLSADELRKQSEMAKMVPCPLYAEMELCIDTPNAMKYDAVKLVAQALGGAKGSYRLVSMLEVPGNNGN